MSHDLYLKGASLRLKEALEDASRDEAKRLDLSAEVDAMRLLCARSMRVFDETHFGEKADAFTPEMKAAARASLKDHLAAVTEQVQQAAKTMTLLSGTFTPAQVEQLITQIENIVERRCTETVKTLIIADIKAIRIKKDQRPTINIQIA